MTQTVRLLLPVLFVILQSGGSTALSLSPETLDDIVSGNNNCSLLTRVDEFVELLLSQCRVFFYESTCEEVISTPLSNISIITNHPKFIKSFPTVVIVHGYIQDAKDSEMQTVKESYCKSGEYNILMIDWSPGARLVYSDSVAMVEYVCKNFSYALISAVEKGFITDVICVGFSLGAQLVGCISRSMKGYNGTVKEVVALDPAGPLYSGFPACQQHISPEDGQRVVVIHTNAGCLGTKEQCGHVDVMVNGGSRQENCIGCTCSHIRALYFWAECVLNNSSCLAVRCDSEDNFYSGKCAGNEVARIGQNEMKGEYFLCTRGSSPYCMGEDGLSCEPGDDEIHLELGDTTP